MKKQTPKKLEIFLLLALRRMNDAADENFSAFAGQLSKPEAEKFERLRLKYQNKSDDEKRQWLDDIKKAIVGENFLIDDNIHRSHVEAVLSRETSAIQEIIKTSLPPVYHFDAPPNLAKQFVETQKSDAVSAIEKTIRKTFAAQFVALRDLPEIKMFDRLSGAQLARLVRFAGIREVAFACARIKSVESLGAFLRRFEPEDARAIAAQLGNLPKIADERISFAENLVHNALEIEPQPTSAMLGWLGIRLVGITLCALQKSTLRIAYTEQKLPLETVPPLSVIIETQCRRTPDSLKQKISAEIEELAEMVSGHAAQTGRIRK